MVEFFDSPVDAVAGIPDGSTVMIGGFGAAGQPVALIEALIAAGLNRPHRRQQQRGQRRRRSGRADPRGPGAQDRSARSRARSTRGASTRSTAPGEIELELVPQGNLAERIRAAGAGIGGFFTPTGYGTPLAEGKEVREIDGRHYVLEYPIRADFALVRAHIADRLGNLVYRKTARNFGPIMAAAATTTIVEVTDVVPVGGLDPENVVTPSIYVDRVVRVEPREAR